MSQLNVNIIKNRVGTNGPTISGNTAVSGILTATKFVGDGSGLTNINAGGDGTLDSLVVTGVSTFNGNATFDGNVTIGGTLTYQDVTSIDAVGMITARKGVQILADGLTVTGVSTFTNGAFIPDNQYLNIGNDSDLRLYHTGTASFIEDPGIGNLIIGSNGGRIKITKGPDTENLAEFVVDGPVNLYYDNLKKFETTDTGVNITGTQNVSGIATVGNLDGVIYSGVSVTATSKTVVNREFCEVTAASQTITLPASPSVGQQVIVAIGNFKDTIVARNGSNIMSLAEDMTLDVAYKEVSFTYVNVTIGWRID
jgi:hypothetical protein